jgi:hypothetical protein
MGFFKFVIINYLLVYELNKKTELTNIVSLVISQLLVSFRVMQEFLKLVVFENLR